MGGFVIMWVVLVMAGVCTGDLQADQKECQAPLTSLATCFPFVQGTDKAPAKDCCTNLKTVRESKPKCLCILIKDSTTPALGFSINTTLALEMPSLCKVNANISQCPDLLKISPSSPEAKIFGGGNTSSPTSASSGSQPSSTSSTKSESERVRVHPDLMAISLLLSVLGCIKFL